MRANISNINLTEMTAYTLLSVAAASFVFYIFYFDPVNYFRFISEDQWGENGTAVSFAVAGVLLFVLSFRQGPRLRRLIWVAMGLVAIFAAGEEVSWGQRIFQFSTPEFLQKINAQEEFNIHNIEGSSLDKFAILLAYLVFGWSIFSVVVSFWMPRLCDKIRSYGLPLIPPPLVPIFLCFPYFLLFSMTLFYREIAELFLGIAVGMWAFDLFLEYGWFKGPRGLRSVGMMAGLLFLVAFVSVVLTQKSGSQEASRLNHLALQYFSSENKYNQRYNNMYDQAQRIYEYIFAHPEYYISVGTRINYGRVLLKLGRQEEAFGILSDVAKTLEAESPPEENLTPHLRRLGIVFLLLGLTDRANAEFDRAIELDQQSIAVVTDPDSRARLLFSIAQTLEARGEVGAAFEKAKEAEKTATSASLRREIRERKRLYHPALE